MRFLRNEFEQEWEDELEFESELEFEFSTEIEYQIGDLADAANQGQDPNPYHDIVLAKIVDDARSRKWQDLRREQAQVAGTVNPVQATQRANRSGRGRGMNFPDLSGVDVKGQRTHIEVDTSETGSRGHQYRIFAADANKALRDNARKARGVFFVIDPTTGNVTSVRHVSHRQDGGNTPVQVTRQYGDGVSIANLLQKGVLNHPVSSNTRGLNARQPARSPMAPKSPGFWRPKETEVEGEDWFYL